MRLAACALAILMAAGTARGNGYYYGYTGYYSYYAPTYAYSGWFYPVWAISPSVCYPAYASVRVVPLVTPSAPLATPRPAPPSKESTDAIVDKSKEPPLAKPQEKRGPTIVESRSPTVVTAAAKDHCKVGFWNLTGKDVELTIAGKKQTLAKDKAFTLELEREFSWSIGAQPAATERVPEDRPFHEIVLRND